MDPNSLHKFYEANLPEYERRDLIRVTKFFLGEIGQPTRHPFKTAGKVWEQFKNFVVVKWQGDTKTENPVLIIETKKEDFGRCKCGGRFVKRQNRTQGNFFLGCSKYPKCKQTKQLEQ